MINLGLTICSYFIKNRNTSEKEGIINLNDTFNLTMQSETKTDNVVAYTDIMSVFQGFFNRHSVLNDNENENKLFSCKCIKIGETDKFRFLYGTVHSGSYGIEADITNRQSLEIVYQKKQDDAEVKKFYIFVVIPKDTKQVKVQKGLLLCQSIGTYGVKTITTKYMRQFFSDLKITLEFRSVSLGIFLENLLNHGYLKRLTYVKNRISPDFADNISLPQGKEEISFINPKLGDGFVEKLKNYVLGKSNNTLKEVPLYNYDNLKMTFELNSKTRTINFNDLDKLSITEAIPSNVQLLNGMPDENKLLEHMKMTAEDYLQKLAQEVTE